ncbi:hypothetical protein [Methylococcus sp. Mc7]|uniref:hypothetical protein n=1 Tax=Methylococcus sp. Mc7 TaxID=2860258 RepID=UPI001C5326B9|nr:hypothetical protein [Methylococcus sp. Mc7]QXP85927.1 hypothetical protein KW115_09655 [Methylococcus sp. Mc7]
MAGNVAQAVTISWTASTGYSSTQGPIWYYQSKSGSNFIDLTYESSSGWWRRAGAYPIVGSGWQHPGDSDDSVLKFKAPYSGSLSVTGTVADSNSACGDGVVASILRNGVQVWTATIANGNTTGVSHSLTLGVMVNDSVQFVVNRGASDKNCDSTTWDPTVTYTSTLTTQTINGPSGGDDRAVIQSAIDNAIAAGNREVVLRGGTYLLSSYDSLWGAHLVVNGGSNIVLRGYSGETVKLLMGIRDVHGILVNGTQDITVDNVIIDWSAHPFGQGTVSSVDAANKTIWVKNDSGYPAWDDSFFNESTATILFSRSSRNSTPPSCALYHGTGPSWGYSNGKNWFKYVNTTYCTDGIAAGQKVVLIKNSWTSTALFLQSVKGAMISNLTLYAAPGPGVLNTHSDRGVIYAQINFTNYQIVYHPTDTTRTITTNADGIHSTGSRAAIFVNNSLMKGMMDDGMNLHTRTGYFVARWQYGSQWVISFVPGGGFGDWRVGDLIDIYSIKTKTRHCTVTAQSAPFTQNCSGYTCLYVSAPMYGTSCTGMTSYNGNNALDADQVSNMNQTIDVLSGQSSVIENNQILGHRGRSILNRMWNTVIRNNLFGTSSSHSNFTGIYEGWCFDEGYTREGTLVTPTQNPTQVIGGNTGYWGNTVGGCQ